MRSAAALRMSSEDSAGAEKEYEYHHGLYYFVNEGLEILVL